MNNFEQLMITDNSTMTIEQRKFIDLHNEIIHCGKMTCEFAIQLAKKLKEMRDDKIFINAGFETFSDYVENAVGLKERQAYNYIKVYEDLPTEFLHSNAKIGITKLTLLSSLSIENRDEIINAENIEEISVRELKEKIKELENASEQLQLDLHNFTNEKKEILENNKLELESLHSSHKKQLEKIQKEKDKLKKEIEDLKKAPKQAETIIEKDPQLEKELMEKSKLLKDKENELLNKQKEIDALNKKLAVNDDAVLVFKYKFEQFQKSIDELLIALDSVSGDKRDNCIKAIKTVLDGLSL